MTATSDSATGAAPASPTQGNTTGTGTASPTTSPAATTAATPAAPAARSPTPRSPPAHPSHPASPVHATSPVHPASPMNAAAAAAAAAASPGSQGSHDNVHAPNPTVGNEPVEIDDTVDHDSAYDDDDIQSYTTSLASSVQRFHVENGRRYQSADRSYQFPNDDQEQDRLDMLSHIVGMMTDFRLHLAPLDKPPRRVLDVGTGTGIWAIEAGEKWPDAEIIGNDISPIQPRWVPPNVRFEVDDVEAPWPARAPFDYIHIRYMCGSIKSWPRLLEQAWSALAPGGWLEVGDYTQLHSQDAPDLPASHPLVHMYALANHVFNDILGQELSPGRYLREWMAALPGSSSLSEEVFALPLGVWPKDPKLKRIGALNLVQFLEGCEAYVLGPFTRYLGWSPEEVQVFLAQVRREARRKENHFLFKYHVVYAQKPLDA